MILLLKIIELHFKRIKFMAMLVLVQGIYLKSRILNIIKLLEEGATY